MAAQDILKSFLISLGWQNDEVAAKKVFESIGKMEKSLVGVVIAAEAAALGVVAALGKMAQGFEKAYYQSSRTGSTVAALNAFKYAASQTGSTADEASAAVENLALKIRENRGFRTLVQNITGDKSNDVTRQITELGTAFSRMTSEQAHATASLLGLPEHLLLALQNPEFAKYQAEYQAKARAMGVDLEKAAQDGKSLTQALRDVRSTLDLIVDSADSPLFQQLDKPLRDLNAFLLAHGKDIADILGRIAGALLKLFTAVVEHLPDLDRLAERMGGWETVFTGLAAIISVAFVGRLAGMLGSLRAMTLLGMPPWMLAVLGVGVGAAAAYNSLDDKSKANIAAHPAETLGGGLGGGDFDDNYGSRFGRWLKKKMGGDRVGRKGLMTGERNPGSLKGTQAPDPQNSGTYRPQYKVGDKDTSDAVVNTIAGEAITSNGQSVDAVINNMMNRVGTESYGPSGNLEEVARARGQYAGYRKASAKEAEYIRSRIKAIGSGGVPDNTNGANEYRAGTYTGPWAQNHANAPIIGGNRFAYNPKGGLSPYAPYEHPKIPVKTPPMLKPGGYMPKHDGSAVPIPTIKPLPGDAGFNPSIVAPPLGSQSSNDNSKSVTVIDNSKTSVSGVSDPQKAADHIGRIGDRQSSLLLRNLQSAVG